MSNIEDEVVSMKFDNKQFESGVSTSLKTIDKLKGSLAFPDAGKGLSDINRGIAGFNMNPMHNAVKGVSKTWLGLTTVAITAISNITNKVVDSALSLAKSFTIDPITQGFQEYEKNLNSVQTIMANTGKPVKVVNKYLSELNTYSDQTIYNFGTMAEAIGKFTAAGVKVDDATTSIKGLANSAALGGSSVEQLNTAMYQVSQALATGTIKLQDWNSLSNAGLGGKNMQELFKTTATTVDGAGDAMEAAIGKAGNFRDSLTEGWLSSEVFNKSMKVMAGRTNEAGKTVAFTVKELKKMGYSEDAAKQLNKLSGAAIDSATKVKTFSQLIDVVKESIGSGWSQVFMNLFGNFNQASKLWTGVSEDITGAIGSMFGAVNGMLVGWRKLGGFEELWASFGNIFKTIGNLLGPIIALFQAILPTTGDAGKGLYDLTHGFYLFTGWLEKATRNVDVLIPLFTKTGEVIGWVWKEFKTLLGYAKLLAPVFSAIGGGLNDLVQQGRDIGDNLLSGIVEGLGGTNLKSAIVEMANNIITWVKDVLGIRSPATTMVPIGINIMQGIAEGISAAANVVIDVLAAVFSGIGKALKWMVSNINYGDVIKVINDGLFIAIVLAFRKFLGSFTSALDGVKGAVDSVGGVLDQMTSNLKTMQTKVKSDIIRNIAISIGILAASAFVLAQVDGKKLGISLGAIAGMMITLLGVMTALNSDKVGNDKGVVSNTASMLAMSVALIAFSTAVLILVGAVALMGQLDPETIKKGLAGIAGVIGLIVTATAILGKTGGGATMIGAATALLILAAALVAFVKVMKIYAELDMQTIINGGGKAALVIVGLGLAMRAFGKNAIGGSIGLVIASAGLRLLAGALTEISKIGAADMVKTVLAIVVVLGALAVAGMAMSAAQGGATAILVMSVALIVLAKALSIIAKIPFWDLIKAIGAIVLTLVAIAAAAVLLTPAVPLIAALGTALLLFGVAILAAGAGFLAFAIAMGILAVVGPAAFQALHDGIGQLLDLLPEIGEALGEMIVSFFTGIAKAAGPLAKALGKLLGILIDELTKLVPKASKFMKKVIFALIDVVESSYERLGRAAIRLVLALLDALNDGVPKMITKGTKLIIALIKGLGKAAAEIVDVAGQTIVKFLRALDKAVQRDAPVIGRLGTDIAVHLVDGLTQGIRDRAGEAIQAAKDLARDVAAAIGDALKIFSPSRVTREMGGYVSEGMALGINDKAKMAVKSSEDMARKSVDMLRMTFAKSKDAANGLTDIQPKIKPVLDLSQVAKDAQLINGHLNKHTIRTDLARSQARDIAADQAARHGKKDEVREGDTYNFEQIINSPKPVNHVKAYRGTKSQIALMKEVTGK